jgi:Abnormal spindle-like microcephaly-assoc'd, ASPM-SPD-2-Hydin
VLVLAFLLGIMGCGLVNAGGGSSSEQTASPLSPSSSSVSFGNVTTGASATESVVLTDSGTSNITIKSIAISGSNFSVKSGAAVTLAPNQTTTIAVMFTPSGAGSSQGTLTIASDASDGSMNIMLTGMGVAASSQLSASSTTLTLGNVTVGSSATMPVVVTDQGTANVTVSSATISGAGFSFTASSSAPLSPNGTVTYTVKFDPTAAGASQGTLTINSDATNSTLNISVSGTGVAAPSSKLTTPTTNLTFGNVTVGTPVTKTVTLTNSGTAVVTISNATTTGTGFSASAAGTSVNPDKTLAVSVTFNPTKTGAVTGTLSVSSNATNSVIQIPLSATAIAPSGPATQTQSTLTANTTAVGFGSVTVGTLVTQSVILTDSGTASVTISGVSTKGNGFSSSGGTNATLTPNGSVTISVSFDPASAAAAQGTLTVSSNASNTTLSIPLTGTGVAPPATQHSVALNWQPSTSQVSGYFVYRGSSASNTTKLFLSSIAATSYKDSSVVDGQTYFYAVTSVDADSVESAPSNEVSVTIPTQ